MLSGSKTRFKAFKAYRLYRRDFWGVLLDKKQHRYRGCIYDILKYKKGFYNKLVGFVYGGKKIMTKRYSYGGQLFLTKQRFRLSYNNMKTAQVGDLLALARRRRLKRFDFYDKFFGLLESRLDSLLVRSLFISNFKQARLFIQRRAVYVNGFVVKKVNFLVKVGDVISIKDITELGYFFKLSFIKYLTVFDFVLFIKGFQRLNREYDSCYSNFLSETQVLFFNKADFLFRFLQFISKFYDSLKKDFLRLNRHFVRYLLRLLILLVLFGNYKNYLSSLFWLLVFRGGRFYKNYFSFLYNRNNVRLKLVNLIRKEGYSRVIGESFLRFFLSKSDFVGDLDELKVYRLSKTANEFIKFKRFNLRRWKSRRRSLGFEGLSKKSARSFFFFDRRKLYFFFGYPLYIEVSYKVFRLIVTSEPVFQNVPLFGGLDGFKFVEFFRRRLYF